MITLYFQKQNKTITSAILEMEKDETEKDTSIDGIDFDDI